MNVKDIVEMQLKTLGYDGLYSVWGDCACEIGDLVPCGEDFSTCMPGYRYVCKNDAGCEFGTEEHWHMRKEK